MYSYACQIILYFGCISLNIACEFKCYISKSKLVLSECNDLYFIAIAFTLHEIKQQCPVFFGGGGGTRYFVARSFAGLVGHHILTDYGST